MSDNVTVKRDGPVVTLTLNRPDRRNSLSDPMLIDLGSALTELRDDASSRVVILTGAPPVFSAGADAPHARAKTDEERRRLFERVTSAVEGLEQATIAMINGHAVGGGWGLALAFDFRFASTDAQLWIPEVDLGVPLGVASTTRFIRMVGPAKAKEIIMGCHRYTAAEAHAMGLVTRVVPGAELEGAVKDYAQHLLKKPFRALAEVKARINAISANAAPVINAMTEGFLDRG